MSALEELVAVYEDPAPVLEQWRGRVVGYLGRDVPRELVAAAGLLPYRLRGAAPPSARADEILGPRVERPVRSVLGELLEGRTGCDFLLLSHDSDSLVRLFTSLRVLPGPLPEVWFLDLLHLPVETTEAYNRARLEELRGVLERWSGSSAGTGERPDEALLARVAELRREERLRGSDALAVAGAGEILPAADYNRLLQRLLEEDHDSLPAGRRAYVTGSGQASPDLYRRLEGEGMHVVGEDAVRLHGTNERAAHTAREAESIGADLVLAWIGAGDDAFAWGLPALRRALSVELVVEHE